MLAQPWAAASPRITCAASRRGQDNRHREPKGIPIAHPKTRQNPYLPSFIELRSLGKTTHRRHQGQVCPYAVLPFHEKSHKRRGATLWIWQRGGAASRFSAGPLVVPSSDDSWRGTAAAA